MKISIRLAVAQAASFIAMQSAVANQTPMEHVLVSVPIHKKQAETALPVTILSGDELQRQAAATIGETLGNQPGIISLCAQGDAIKYNQTKRRPPERESGSCSST